MYVDFTTLFSRCVRSVRTKRGIRQRKSILINISSIIRSVYRFTLSRLFVDWILFSLEIDMKRCVRSDITIVAALEHTWRHNACNLTSKFWSSLRICNEISYVYFFSFISFTLSFPWTIFTIIISANFFLFLILLQFFHFLFLFSISLILSTILPFPRHTLSRQCRVTRVSTVIFSTHTKKFMYRSGAFYLATRYQEFP